MPRSNLRIARPLADAASPPARDIINALWIGQLSPVEYTCLESFVALGHPVHLYTYDEIAKVPEGVTQQDAGQILPRSCVFQNQRGKGKGSLAAFSDLFRYKLLLERGGWWVDTDIFCLRPFDFSAPYVFGAEDKPVASGVIKMPRGCELARRCYEDAKQVDPASIVWNELVQILERNVRGLGLMKYVIAPHHFSPIGWQDIPDHVVGRKLFLPESRSYAVHLYNEMWRRNKLDKWRSYGETSVLNVLRRHAGLSEPQLTTPQQPATLMKLADRWLQYLPWRKAA